MASVINITSGLNNIFHNEISNHITDFDLECQIQKRIIIKVQYYLNMIKINDNKVFLRENYLKLEKIEKFESNIMVYIENILEILHNRNNKKMIKMYLEKYNIFLKNNFNFIIFYQYHDIDYDINLIDYSDESLFLNVLFEFGEYYDKWIEYIPIHGMEKFYY